MSQTPIFVFFMFTTATLTGAYYEWGSREKRIMPDEKRLLQKLLGGYETASRPVYNASNVVTVKFGLTLIQILDLDEVNQVLTANAWLEQEWEDESLTWDPDDYNGLKKIRIPCDRIWLPDTVLYNSADDYIEGFMQSKVMVTHTGNVFWPPPANLISSCKIDITYFPFDDQICKMKFGSWAYDGFQVDITNRSASVDLQNYIPSGKFELLSIDIKRNEKTYACCPEPYPDVTFTFILHRRSLFYLYNIIFPCLGLTALSLLSFWLPPNCGEKVTLAITVLLSFSVFMLLIAENVPSTSESVPLIGIYLSVTMVMTALNLAATVMILQLNHVGPHQRPVPRWIKRVVIECMARVMCMHTTLVNYYGDNYHGNKWRWAARKIPSCNHPGETCFSCPREEVKYTKCETEHDVKQQRSNFQQLGEQATDLLLVNIARHGINHQEVVNEWKLVALVFERFLFWLFLAGSILSSIITLVFMQWTKPPVI